ncbi:DsbA family protein [Cryobacterium sp. Hb1]|uniref:DsbA family oxidoreductase n=1 Tax=Cryobacterium sp. Hb1 TaxID=1259147 RepID=UPI003519D9A0
MLKVTDTNTSAATASTTSPLTGVDPIKVDIWSDVQCPWCYIGKRKFEAGAAQFDGIVEVEYHSFELSPDTPVDYAGTPSEYLSEAKGMSAGQVAEMLERVTGIAESVGLHYDYDSVHQTNTVISHELLHYAKAHGRQIDMKERLLKAYFVDGRHIGRIEDLADLAAEIGLDRADVVRALTAHDFLADVKADVALATEYGIQGVPFFVIDGKYGISGAQDPATFTQALNQILTERSEEKIA